MSQLCRETIEDWYGSSAVFVYGRCYHTVAESRSRGTRQSVYRCYIAVVVDIIIGDNVSYVCYIDIITYNAVVYYGVRYACLQLLSVFERENFLEMPESVFTREMYVVYTICLETFGNLDITPIVGTTTSCNEHFYFGAIEFSVFHQVCYEMYYISLLYIFYNVFDCYESLLACGHIF